LTSPGNTLNASHSISEPDHWHDRGLTWCKKGVEANVPCHLNFDGFVFRQQLERWQNLCRVLREFLCNDANENFAVNRNEPRTDVLRQLALALAAGGGALRRFRGSTVKNKEGKESFNPLNPPIQGMGCSIDDVADYVSWYDSAIRSKQEADRRFIQLINELQAVLPAVRWRGMEKESGIDSIRSYTYADQNSDAHIDLDLVVQLQTGGEYFYLVTIFGWAATEPRL
jgi:hypothetical protein